MGWNSGYTVYEQTVIAVYDAGNLTPETLRAIILPYRDTDIDHGGCRNLETRDGLSADEVVLKLLAPAFWKEYEARGRDCDMDFSQTWREVMGSW